MGKTVVDDAVEEVEIVPWHTMTVEEVAAKVEGDMAVGLTAAEAAKRLELYGPNLLTEKRKDTIWERIWRQVNNVLVLILVVVAVVSAIKAATSEGEDAATSWVEVVLIIGVIVLNTWIGIRQEGSAERSADALKAMLSSDALVIRDGSRKSIQAEDLVYGDLVVLGTGDSVPADMRLTRVTNLSCQEAALTGEALPVDKVSDPIEPEGGADPKTVPLGDRKNMAFSATLVAQGESLALVTSTGDNTEIGEINTLVSQVETKKTNVLVQIDMVSKYIAIFVIITAITTFLIALLYTDEEAIDAVSIALVTSVAMIPEGLAAIVTLTYAFAVSNMAKKHAIVRVLPAVETLGSVTVICSDKTGTLTKNEMTLTCLVTSNARYKFNTDATERVPGNFVREDKFMSHTRLTKAEREAKEAKGEKVEDPAAAAAATSEVKMEVEVAGGEPDEAASAAASASASAAGSDGSDGPVAEGQSPNFEFVRSVLAGGVLCSNAMIGANGGKDGDVGNPTELAIVRATYFANCDYDTMREEQPIMNQVPFSSEYKFMATIHTPKQEIDGRSEGVVVHVKGAPDRLIALAAFQAKAGVIGEEHKEPIDRQYWLDAAENLSSHGLRCLALCRAELPAEEAAPGTQLGPEFVSRAEPFLTMVGICAIVDPPRPECVSSIQEAHGAGVVVKMITGDHKATALAIGDQLGLVDPEHPDGITGPELDAQSDEELRKSVLVYNVFARASPENKIRIVRALQAEGQVVSMTGDGVNDAPALKAADMGVAMGKEGTDVARESAEMILADDNFATIVSAVKEGRAVWDNLRKVLLFNTPVNNAQGMTVLFGLIAGMEDTPLTPIQVLYCNLICAVTLGFVLAVEPPEEGIMELPPRRVGKRLIGRFLFLRIVIGTIVLVLTTVGSVFIWRSIDGPTLPESDDNPGGFSDEQWEEQRAQASNTLTFGAISICLSARFAYNSSIHPRLFTGNPWAWYSVGIVVVLQLCITYIPGLNSTVFSMGPMDYRQWLLVLGGMTITFIVMEVEKGIRRKLKNDGVDTDDVKPDHIFDEAPHPAPEGPLVPDLVHNTAALHNTLEQR